MAEEKNGKTKPEARSEAFRRLRALNEATLAEAQTRLTFHLSSFLKDQKGRWGAYRPIPGEASPTSSIQKNQHLRWAYPCVRGDVLEFYLDPKTWLAGPFGIEEPTAPQELDGYLVPGLGFDRSGTRLGRGRGFFDRALESFEGLRVGVAFETQVFQDTLPRESFDVPMDVIITDRGIYFIHTEGDRRND
jgi:5-formyltetrahydrofolate cyclo-ligase